MYDSVCSLEVSQLHYRVSRISGESHYNLHYVLYCRHLMTCMTNCRDWKYNWFRTQSEPDQFDHSVIDQCMLDQFDHSVIDQCSVSGSV